MLKTKPARQGALSDAHPVYLYEANKLVLKDGRVAVAFRLEAAEMEKWDAGAFTTAHTVFQQALKTLPVGAVFQKTDIYYDRPYVHPPAPDKLFEQRMAAYFGNRMVLYHHAYLFLSFAPVPAKTGRGFDASSPKSIRPVSALNALVNRVDQALPPNPFTSVADTLALAEKHATEFTEALRGVPDIALHRLDENQVRQLYLQFLNLEFDQQPQHYERELLNSEGTLTIGEQKVSCVSMTGQGTEMYPCVKNGYGVVSPMVFPLTQFLSMPHVFTQAVRIVDTKEELAALDRDKRLNSSLAKFATQDNHLRVAEIEAFSAEVRAAGKQLCYLHASLLLWEANDDLRRKNVEGAAAALRSLYSAEVAIEASNNLLVFFGSLPGNAFQIPDRWLPTTTDRAACYTHWTTTYRPTPTGEYLCDRFGNLTRVDLFDLAQDNQNSLTIGPSGSGKSYAMGNLIVQRFENGARQIIIDVGGSYRNICQSLTRLDFEKCYFEYDPANPIEFNPFFVPRDSATRQWQYTDEKLNFHLALLATIWKHGELSKSEKAILARLLRAYYRKLNELPALGQAEEVYPGMNSFYHFVWAYHKRMTDPVAAEEVNDEELQAQREQYRQDLKYIEINQFFIVLGDYVGEGRYHKVLNARLDVDLSDYPLICFDMQRVKADPTLYPVVAMLITELSMDLFRKYPNHVKYILMDEAWSMLSGSLQDFIESMYRTIRKTKGSIGIITQGIDDIVKSTIGYTLINNSATKIILRHESEGERAKLSGPLGFTSLDMDLIGSMRKNSSSREFFIKQGSRGKVFMLEASPQLNAVLTSRPTERNYLNQLVQHYQRHIPQLVLDGRGRPQLDERGQPTYTTRVEQRLDFAVDEFVATTSR